MLKVRNIYITIACSPAKWDDEHVMHIYCIALIYDNGNIDVRWHMGIILQGIIAIATCTSIVEIRHSHATIKLQHVKHA